MHTTLVTLDSSPQLLPEVGGRDQASTRIDPDSAHKIAAALDAAGHPLDIYVIAERALAPTETKKLPGTVPVDLAEYVRAGFDGIYGALGLHAPGHLTGAQPALDPESLGHAAIRYVLGQAVHPDGTRECAPGRGTVHLFEVGGALGAMVRGTVSNAWAKHHHPLWWREQVQPRATKK